MDKELSPQWVLLGLLTHKPMHGYELHQSFAPPSPLAQIWYLGISQMYKLLRELEAQGYVEVSVEPQEARPDRKVYHVTAPGRQAFLHWLQTPVDGIRLMRVEFLGKLYLAQTLDRETVERIIDLQAEACRVSLRHLEKTLPGPGFQDLVLRFRTGQLEAALEWLDYCRHALLAGTPESDL
jgi:PadR family transcriptional regulator AphA